MKFLAHIALVFMFAALATVILVTGISLLVDGLYVGALCFFVLFVLACLASYQHVCYAFEGRRG